MTEETIHGKVVAKRKGLYTVYVFQIDDNSYRMCTLLPHWGNEYDLEIGETGFLTIQSYIAGEKYYNRHANKEELIQFTNVYLKEFIKDKIKTQDIIL